jgi:hypothetical protein
MTIVLLLASYCIGITIVLLLIERRRSRERDDRFHREKIADLSDMTPLERLQNLVELAKLDRGMSEVFQ